MKHRGFLVWSVVLAVAILAGVLGARAQGVHTTYLPLIASSPPGPTIHYFRANVEIADPGDTIQLEWASTGGVEASLWRISRGGPIAGVWDVAPTGAFSYTISTAEREYVQFSLYVTDAEGVSSGAGLTVPLTCPDSWFFSPEPDGCPGAPAHFANGAEQPFESGYMVWVEEGWTEGQAGIYVLYDDEVFSPRWAFYPDTWEEGEPLCDVGEAPPGLFQPERGFGRLWCDEPGVRDRLGWATEPETGYETAVQRDSAPRYTTLYVRAADGNVWKLLPERSGWEKITVE
ncbi:MAG TPA: hypothetical protein VK879_09445 [Candidatus Sulfomarinibacteraceae bacterium]|nr:hypothetical protein [Candidatus Sulfomarinibacteraceae bacterium]